MEKSVEERKDQSSFQIQQTGVPEAAKGREKKSSNKSHNCPEMKTVETQCPAQ